MNAGIICPTYMHPGINNTWMPNAYDGEVPFDASIRFILSNNDTYLRVVVKPYF